VIGSILTVQTIHHTVDRVRSSPEVSTPVRTSAVTRIEDVGPSFRPARGTPPAEAAALDRALDEGVADGARIALFFAAGVVLVGSCLSVLIPRIGPFAPDHVAVGAIAEFEAFEPMDPDPALLHEVERADPAPPG
jgi:hypothetical protein